MCNCREKALDAVRHVKTMKFYISDNIITDIFVIIKSENQANIISDEQHHIEHDTIPLLI